MHLGRVTLRTAVGVLFMGHGLQKLAGWFGGHGIDGTAGFFESIGMRPGKVHAIAAGAAETGGGALLVLGAAFPLPNAMLIATMLTAIARVHAANGPWAADGGYEYNLVLIAALLALAETGPGTPSLDAGGDESHGSGSALLALALGTVGALGADAVSHAVAASDGDAAPAA